MWVDELFGVEVTPQGDAVYLEFDSKGNFSGVKTVKNTAPTPCPCIFGDGYLAMPSGYYSYYGYTGVASCCSVGYADPNYECVLSVFRIGTLLNTLTAPTVVTSGATFNATVGLNGPSPVHGSVVSMTVSGGTFSNGLTTETVTVPAGQTSVATAINTPPLSAAKLIVITAQELGVSRTLIVTESAPAIKSISLQQTITAAANTTDPYQVILDGKAAAGGVGVTITSSNTAVIPNSTTTVPANGTSVSGNLTVNKVTATQSVTVTFKTSTGSSVSKVVTVNP